MIPPENMDVLNWIFITKKDILFRTDEMYENERLCSVSFYKPNKLICQDCHKIHMTFFRVQNFLLFDKLQMSVYAWENTALIRYQFNE